MGEQADVGFVTGTDTGVGKTVFAALLARRMMDQGFTVRAVKPFASGGREDGRVLREATGNQDELNALNPWHYRAALSPLIAARREGNPVRIGAAIRFIERSRKGVERLVVEGAGGLLSPLGEGWDARTLIRQIRPRIWIVAANRLGCLNQVLLTVEGLGSLGAAAKVIVMQPLVVGVTQRTNLDWLRERLGRDRVQAIPWLPRGWQTPWRTSWVHALDWT